MSGSNANQTVDTANSSGNFDPIEQFLWQRVASAQSALWKAECVRRGLTLAIAILAGILAWWIIDQWIWSPGILGRSVLVGGGLMAIVIYAITQLWPVLQLRVRPDYAARSLERDYPELGHSLSSYVSLKQQAAHPTSGKANPRSSGRAIHRRGSSRKASEH